jgi:hypothetical protein
MTKPETRIVKQIERWILSEGGEVLKLHGSAMQRTGEPDLIGGFGLKTKYAGVHFVYEVKLPDEEPRPDQLYRLERWANAYYSAGWGTSLGDFIHFIREAKGIND